MAYLALIIVSAIYAGVLVYILRGQNKERDTLLRAVALSIQEGTKERETHALQVSELTEKIQHPEIVHPPRLKEVKPGPPPEPDPAFSKTGRVFPADDNGAA